jgi:chemotaxis protein methyltransferase CheR
MNDERCVSFLQWALPRMGMRWKGFRKVRRQVCRRIRDRIGELELTGHDAYREYLEAEPAEWECLAILCRVTISRFQRDREVFRVLVEEVLPRLAECRGEVRAWSVGCASGEEPYTLSLLWRLRSDESLPGTELRILATDVDPAVLARAREARYPRGALRELAPESLERAFEAAEDEELRLREAFREGVTFRRQDVRREMPAGSFHLILCRNLVFTYFDEAEQRRILAGLLERLEPGGILVLGSHERLPEGTWPLEPRSGGLPIYRKGVERGG